MGDEGAMTVATGPMGPRVLVAHGVNLDLLGRREPGIYGKATLDEINTSLRAEAAVYASYCGLNPPHLEFFQTNDEAMYLNALSSAPWDGMLLNPGAWTHSSLALRDRLLGLGVPFVEVHLSHLGLRESYRQESVLSVSSSVGVVQGFGRDSYSLGLLGLLRKLSERLS